MNLDDVYLLLLQLFSESILNKNCHQDACQPQPMGQFASESLNVRAQLRPWKVFRGTGILAKNLNEYGIFL